MGFEVSSLVGRRSRWTTETKRTPAAFSAGREAVPMLQSPFSAHFSVCSETMPSLEGLFGGICQTLLCIVSETKFADTRHLQ
jgi:hypothetical protein